MYFSRLFLYLQNLYVSISFFALHIYVSATGGRSKQRGVISSRGNTVCHGKCGAGEVLHVCVKLHIQYNKIFSENMEQLACGFSSIFCLTHWVSSPKK